MSDYLMEVVDKELINNGIRPTDLNFMAYVCVEQYYMTHKTIPFALVILGPGWLNEMARRMEYEIMA